MRRRIYIIILLLVLVVSAQMTVGEGDNKTRTNKSMHHKHSSPKGSQKTSDRAKRSLDDEGDNPFWPNRGKKEIYGYSDDDRDPFWALRGRRDSSSVENYVDLEKSSKVYNVQKDKTCKNCYIPTHNSDAIYGNVKHVREDVLTPFWGNRGRRSSEESDDQDLPGGLFWGSRGRRQENEPFWGNRGRRQESSPFWGNRGRREEEPFWGNRGRRQSKNQVSDSKSRKEDFEPFWGTRGRREDDEPFWGNRGRRKESDSFWNSQQRNKQDLKQSILNAINDVEDEIEKLSRLRRSEDSQFWSNRSRESKLKHLFNGSARTKMKPSLNYPNFKSPEPSTVRDNTMYAEEPHFIIVERNGRSSAEDDPFYISRGKKYSVDLGKAARDRRGAIEEIVKSVRNDPYYIARGKKDIEVSKHSNSTTTNKEFVKVKELICATIELIMDKQVETRTKRDLADSERDRRTILKKLAAQLQIDPYFVSRGKKSEQYHDTDNFINEVAAKCNR